MIFATEKKKRCPKHVWRHTGSYTEIVNKRERYTEHYRCKECGKSKRVVPK